MNYRLYEYKWELIVSWTKTEKYMNRKHILCAIAFSFLAISGCGSSSPTTAPAAANAANENLAVTVPVEIVDLWSRPDAGTVQYLNITRDGIREVYSDNFNGDNCLRKNESALIPTEGNKYTEGPLFTADITVTVTGDTLTIRKETSSGQVTEVSYERVVGLTVADIPVCS